MNKPMKCAAIALAVVLGGAAAGAEVRGSAAQKLQKQQRAQPAKPAKKPQDAGAGKRAAAQTKPAARKPVATAGRAEPKAAVPPTATAKVAPRPTAAAKVAPRVAAPARAPEVHLTQLPPSRFYPNGIPELRPEFLHPLPSQLPVQTVAGPRLAPHGLPEQLP